MRVLVTGATGYLGSAIARALAAAGHEVRGTARNPEGADAVAAAGHEVVRASLADLDVLRRAAADADAAVNAATTYDLDRGPTERAAVQALLDGLAGRGPLLYTSDQLVYGDTGDEPADEDRPLRPPPFLTWRPEVEQLVRAAGGVVLRPAAVFGRGGNQLFPGLIAASRTAGAGLHVGTGGAPWSFVHVDDVADGYVAALGHARPGAVLNLAAEPPRTPRQVAEAVAVAAGVPGRVRGLGVEEALPVFGPAAALMDGPALAISPARAQRELGWRARRPDVLEDLAHGSYAAAAASTSLSAQA